MMSKKIIQAEKKQIAQELNDLKSKHHSEIIRDKEGKPIAFIDSKQRLSDNDRKILNDVFKSLDND